MCLVRRAVGLSAEGFQGQRKLGRRAWHRGLVGEEVCVQRAVMLTMMEMAESEEVVLSGWRVKAAPRYKG